MLSTPVNLPKWYEAELSLSCLADHVSDYKRTRLEENSHLLKPPINNYCVYNEDFTVMVMPCQREQKLPNQAH